MHTYYVYILASKSRALYIGMTNKLVQRLASHREGKSSHTAKYRIVCLVHVEVTHDVRAAIAREKQLKGWRRDRKLALIGSVNPTWDDLALFS